jgi:multidrug resistance protein, MATE family
VNAAEVLDPPSAPASVLRRLTYPFLRMRSDAPSGPPRPSNFRANAAIAGEVWSLAWPAIAHMALITLVFLVSRAMVARHSTTSLASLQISGTLVWAAYSLCTAFSAGTLAVVARNVGAGDREAAARAARGSLLFAAAIGLLVVVPIRVANGSLLRLLFPQAEATVLAEASAYLHIVLPVLPLGFVEAIAAASLQGSGDTRTPLIVAAAGNVVNVALSAALIFGYAGLPELGVRGAAIGHAATMGIEGVLLSCALLWRRSPLPLLRVKGFRDELRRVLAISLPTFAEKGVYHAGYLAFVAMIGLLGSRAMGANQVLVGIEAICFLSADGFAIAAGAVVAQKLGAGKAGDASRACLAASAMAVALLSAFGVLFATAPRLLIAAFSPDPQIIELGSHALYVAAVAQPFMAFATVVGMGLRGAGDTKTVLWTTLVCSVCVRLGVTYVGAIALGWGLVGVWIGSTADWVVRSVLLGIAFARGQWRRAVV